MTSATVEELDALRLTLVDAVRVERARDLSQRPSGASEEDLDWLIELCAGSRWRLDLDAGVRGYVTARWHPCALSSAVGFLARLLDQPRGAIEREELRRELRRALDAEQRRSVGSRPSGADDIAIELFRQQLTHASWPSRLLAAVEQGVCHWHRCQLTLLAYALAQHARDAPDATS